MNGLWTRSFLKMQRNKTFLCADFPNINSALPYKIYQGQLITSDGKFEEDVNRKIGIAKAEPYLLKSVQNEIMPWCTNRIKAVVEYNYVVFQNMDDALVYTHIKVDRFYAGTNRMLGGEM